jgi:hypothetical protein
MPLTPSYQPKVNGAVVSAVQTAFQRSKTSPRYWQTRRMQGRFDARNVWRHEATDRTDIFRERIAPGATKVNLHILIDGSTSMNSLDQKDERGERIGPSRIQHAADISATLVDAFRKQQQVRMSVWLHNTGATQQDMVIMPIVQNGAGRERIGFLPQLTHGGNGDGYAIQWVANKMRRDHRRGEVDLLIVVSDGLPSWLATARFDAQGNYVFNGVEHVANVVREVRESGARVMAVAIDSTTPNPNFTDMYGKDGDVIPFTGDWNKLAAEFGARLGRTLADAGKEKRGR